MPAFGFRDRFADAVERGAKRQTIRAERRDGWPPARVGQWVTCWRGLRTRACRKLNAGPCTAVLRIEIDGGVFPDIRVDGRTLAAGEQNRLARDDGFGGLVGLIRFLRDTHGLPFRGWIVQWEPRGQAALPPPSSRKE